MSWKRHKPVGVVSGGLCAMRLRDKYDAYLEYLQKKGMTEKTIVEHRRFLIGALSHSIQDRKLSKLTIADAASIMEAGKIHGAYGAQRAVVVFRRYLKFLKDSGIKVPFDWRDIEVPKMPEKAVEYLTPEELGAIRESIRTDDLAGLRTRALIEVLLDTGMRISEAISLNKSDIDWEKKEARITNAKTKEERQIVYFTERSIGWLKKYVEKRRDDMPALFVSGRGRLLSVTARNYLRVHTAHLGIRKHVRHHIFRRTLATKLIQKKVDIKSVQTILRHRSERTTLRYYVGVSHELAKKLHQKVMGRV